MVEAATVEVHDDGTRSVALRGKRPGRPVYFFDRWPRRRSVEYNVKARPDVCIELVDVDYDDTVVRRRWTGPNASAAWSTPEPESTRCRGSSIGGVATNPTAPSQPATASRGAPSFVGSDSLTAPAEPDTASVDELSRLLAGLQRRYRTASHVVAEERRTPRRRRRRHARVVDQGAPRHVAATLRARERPGTLGARERRRTPKGPAPQAATVTTTVACQRGITPSPCEDPSAAAHDGGNADEVNRVPSSLVHRTDAEGVPTWSSQPISSGRATSSSTAGTVTSSPEAAVGAAWPMAVDHDGWAIALGAQPLHVERQPGALALTA